MHFFLLYSVYLKIFFNIAAFKGKHKNFQINKNKFEATRLKPKRV